MTNNLDTGQLADAIWQEAQEQYSNITFWNPLEFVVVQGLERWPEDDLVEAAKELGIDVDEYKEGE